MQQNTNTAFLFLAAAIFSAASIAGIAASFSSVLERNNNMQKSSASNAGEPGLPIIDEYTTTEKSQEQPPLLYDSIITSGQRFYTNITWPGLVQQGVDLTYSFPADGILLGNNAPGLNVLNATLDQQFASLGGRDAWLSLFQQSFDRWGEITGNTYTLVTDDNANDWPEDPGPATFPGSPRGDIRIVMGALEGNVLARNYYPPKDDMIMDDGRFWASQSSGPNFRFLRNLLSHEHGHGIGLEHSCPANRTKNMKPLVFNNFDGPQHDDIRGAQFLYGDRFEPDTVDLEALGIASNASATVTEVSLHDPNDTDVYSFPVQLQSTITATLTPNGTTYLNAPQNKDGSCPDGSPIQSQVHDVFLELISPQNQLLSVVNDNPIGGTETLQTLITSPGIYTIRVRALSGSNTSQMYTLNVQLDQSQSLGDLNLDKVVNAVDLGILLGSWGICPDPPLSCFADLNGNGIVNAVDLSRLLGNWTTSP